MQRWMLQSRFPSACSLEEAQKAHKYWLVKGEAGSWWHECGLREGKTDNVFSYAAVAALILLLIIILPCIVRILRQSISMGFPRQEYWRGLPFSSLGDLANPGIETGSLLLSHQGSCILPQNMVQI